MPEVAAAFLPVIAVLAVLSALSLRWSRDAVAPNLAYLALPYLPTLAMPWLPPAGRALLLGGLALGAAWNFGRMTGMSTQPRFQLPALVAVAATFVAAHLGSERVFSLTPVAGLVAIAALTAVERSWEGYLQKLALAWVTLLVYGWMFAHTVLLARAALPGMVVPEALMATIVLAMGGAVAWSVGERVWMALSARGGAGEPAPGWLHLACTTAGGALVGFALPFVDAPHLVATGAGVGVALGAAGRAYIYVVRDVSSVPLDATGEAAQERKMKGAVLFGFAFSCAMAALAWLG